MPTHFEQLTLKYEVKLPTFEGPFELLLHLIEEEKLPIQDVSLSHLTEQYLEHLAKLQQYRLEISGEFLVMAAFLIKLKAASLLPQPDFLLDDSQELAGIHGRQDLLTRLIEYKFYKDKARLLEEKKVLAELIYFSPFSAVADKRPLLVLNAQVDLLSTAFHQVLERYKAREIPRQLAIEKISLSQLMRGLWDRLKNLAGRFLFQDYISGKKRLAAAVSFLAVLEMIRQGACKVIQENIFGPIYLEKVAGRQPKFPQEEEA